MRASRSPGRHAPLRRVAALALGVLAVAAARADEGMWTFEQPPRAALAQKYQFAPDAAWLDHLRAAALRVAGGSASFVSAQGLVVTNHHVALPCVQRLSSAGRDLVRDGFLAPDVSAERPCPGMEVSRLESIADVTEAVQSAVRARDAAAANRERNAAIAKIENDCHVATGLRCEVETLYRGAAYRLARLKVWSDVRLVFAPESSIAFFGGDTDNFVYPRFDLDVAFLRVYENGAPVRPQHFLRWGSGTAEGELVLAAGHPYETERLKTVAQLVQERDVHLPLRIASAKRQQQELKTFSARSAEAKRRAGERLFGTENWLKGMLGAARALNEPAILASRTAEEQKLRAQYGPTAASDPWARIERTAASEAARLKEEWAVNYGYQTLFDTAGRLVELAHERALPDDERLADYRDSAIAHLTVRLRADEPVYKDLEIVRMAGYWQEALDLLGPEHPFVARVLHGRPPLDVARETIEASHLDDVQVRRALVEGGAAAVDASTDPLVVLARAVYPMRRAIRKWRETEIDEPIRGAGDEIARVRLRSLGTEAYPDATGSLRLSYGVVRGYDADGLLMPWHTNFWGLFARSAAFSGHAPFEVPPRWQERRRTLDLDTPLDFVSTLDIIGGNSGSPVVNRSGELVGLVFDGNLESLGASYGYTEDKARAIAVDARAIVEALRAVYGAAALLREIGQR